MRKLIIFLLIVLLINPLMVYAASVGGALTQGKGKFSVGIDGEYISNRETERESFDISDIVGTPSSSMEQKFKFDNFYRGGIKLTYGLLQYLDVYARIGESGFNYSDMSLDGAISPVSLPFSGHAKIKGKNGLFWAAGLKGSYPVLKTWYLGCDAQYLRQDNLYKGSGDAQGPSIPGGFMAMRWNGKMTFQEWHIAPYLAKKFSTDKFGAFTPYVGGRYSYFGLRDKVRTREMLDASILLQTRRYTADDNWGPFCGLDYSLGEHLTFNVEGRFIDENALSFATTYKF